MEQQALSVAQRRILTFSLILATVMQTLDTTIANVALPHMQGTMLASEDQIAWVLTSYFVSTAIMIPTTGYLARRFGQRRVLALSIVGFTFASMLCGASQNLGEAVLFRAFQGIAGASLVPLSQTILVANYSAAQRGSIIALWSAGVMLGSILGPLLGGYLTDSYSWRWVFYINIPLGMIAFATMMVSVPKSAADQDLRFDWLGFSLLGVGLGALQIMLDRGNLQDWFSSQEIIIEAIVAAIGLYLYIVHSLTAKKPFIDFELFLNRNLTVGLIFMFIIGIILYATMALLPPFLQTLRGYPVLTTGLILAPRACGTMVALIVMGKIMNRFDPRLIMACGLLICAYSLLLMSQFNLEVSTTTIVWTGVIQGLGIAIVFAPLAAVAFSDLPANLQADGASFFQLSRNIGSSMGISVAVGLIAHLTQINHASLAAHISPINPIYRPDALHGLNLQNLFGLELLDGEINRQAMTIAYLNDFRLMMWISLFGILLLLLVKYRKPAPGEQGVQVAID